MRKGLPALGVLLLLWPLVSAPETKPAAKNPGLSDERPSHAFEAARGRLEQLERHWLTWASASDSPTWLQPLVVRTLGARTPQASLHATRALLVLPEQAWDAPPPFTDSPHLAVHHALLLAGVATVPPFTDIEPLLAPTAPESNARLALELELLSLFRRARSRPPAHSTRAAQRQEQRLAQALSRLHRELSVKAPDAPLSELVDLLTLASASFRAAGLESHPQTRRLARRSHALLHASSRHWTALASARAPGFSWDHLLLHANLVETFASYSAAGLAPASRTARTLAPHLEQLLRLVSLAPLEPEPEPSSAWALSATLRALRLAVNVHTERKPDASTSP